MIRKYLALISAALLIAGTVVAEEEPEVKQPVLTDKQALAQAARLILDQALYVSGYCKAHLPKDKELDYKGMLAHVESLVGKENIEMDIPEYLMIAGQANKVIRYNLLDPKRRDGELTETCTNYVTNFAEMEKEIFWKTAKNAAAKYQEFQAKQQ